MPPAETSSEPSTSSSPLVTTPHSSPSTKRPRKSYPPELSAITYLSLGRNRLVPLPSPGGYSDSVVERRLSYVEMQKRRDLTPRSRIFLQLYETTATMLLAEADPQKRRSHQKSLQQYDDFLDKNQDILIANTKVEREIEESLLKLKLFEYFARYGDYFAFQSSRIKKVAEDMKVEGRETLRGYWTDIAKDIQVEMEVAKLNGKTLVCPKRASMLVAVGKFMGVSSDSLITSIMAYGEQNSLVHSGINEFLQKKHYSTVAKLLWQDEKDLPLIMPPERSEEKEALLQIIVALREDIFDIEPGEEDNYQSWNHNKASGKVRADRELAEAREAEIAAKAADRALQIQKEEEKLDAIIYRAREERTVKRTASSEIPEFVKGTEQDRKKK